LAVATRERRVGCEEKSGFVSLDDYREEMLVCCTFHIWGIIAYRGKEDGAVEGAVSCGERSSVLFCKGLVEVFVCDAVKLTCFRAGSRVEAVPARGNHAHYVADAELADFYQRFSTARSAGVTFQRQTLCFSQQTRHDPCGHGRVERGEVDF
jgi:hypothetical protein